MPLIQNINVILSKSGSITDNPATIDDVLSSASIIIDDEEQLGTISKIDYAEELNYDDTLTIPAGCRTGYVRLKSLEEQTNKATATSSDILLDKTGWSNGIQITGGIKTVTGVTNTLTVTKDNISNPPAVYPLDYYKSSNKYIYCQDAYAGIDLNIPEYTATGYSINGIKAADPVYDTTTTASESDVLEGYTFYSYNATTKTLELKTGTKKINSILPLA